MSQSVTALPMLMDEGQAARYLSISEAALCRLRRAGRISHVRLGPRTIRYRQDQLDAARLPAPLSQHVYVIPAREYVKVGIAKNPEDRWRDLQTGNPFIEPIAFMTESITHAAQLEKSVHWKLRQFQFNSTEWFRCSVETAAQAIIHARDTFAAWIEWAESGAYRNPGT